MAERFRKVPGLHEGIPVYGGIPELLPGRFGCIRNNRPQVIGPGPSCSHDPVPSLLQRYAVDLSEWHGNQIFLPVSTDRGYDPGIDQNSLISDMDRLACDGLRFS